MKFQNLILSLVCLIAFKVEAAQIQISRNGGNWLMETATIYGSARYGKDLVIVDDLQIVVKQQLQGYLNPQQSQFPLYVLSLQDWHEVQRRICAEVGGEKIDPAVNVKIDFHGQVEVPVISGGLSVEFYLGHELNPIPGSQLRAYTFRTLHCKVSNSPMIGMATLKIRKK